MKHPWIYSQQGCKITEAFSSPVRLDPTPVASTGRTYGYILKNEDGDVPQEFRTTLVRYKKEFADLGYEIGNIRTLINI